MDDRRRMDDSVHPLEHSVERLFAPRGDGAVLFTRFGGSLGAGDGLADEPKATVAGGSCDERRADEPVRPRDQDGRVGHGAHALAGAYGIAVSLLMAITTLSAATLSVVRTSL